MAQQAGDRYRFLSNSQRLQQAREATRKPVGAAADPNAASLNVAQPFNLGLQSHTSSLGPQPQYDAGYVTQAASVQQFQEQIKVLQAEKEALVQAKKLQDARLEKQRSQWMEERADLIGAAGSTAAEKVIRLSRKNRELSAEMAAHKTQTLRHQKEVARLEEALAAKIQSAERRPVDAVEVENEKLRQQVSTLTTKMSDYRNQCEKLKQEIRVMKNVLGREVGESVDIKKLLKQEKENGSSWRGRQQQITALQTKITELQHVLKESKVVVGDALRSGSKAQETGHDRPLIETSPVAADPRQVEVLQKMEKSKRQAAKDSQDELAKVAAASQELKQRYAASRSRCQTLTDQLQAMKGQMERLRQKSDRDDKLLQKLAKTSPGRQQTHPGQEANGSSPRETDERSMLVQLCAKQEQDIHQLQCKILQLQVGMSLPDTAGEGRPQQRAGGAHQSHHGSSTNVTHGASGGRRKHPSGSGAAAPRRSRPSASAGAASTVSLPAIHSGPLTSSTAAAGRPRSTANAESSRAAPRIVRLELKRECTTPDNETTRE